MDSWSNLCRCCLSPHSEVSILDSDQNVSEKFMEITSIEVKSDDGLPQKLCIDCYAIMNSAFQFRTQCVKMDEELRRQLGALLEQVKEVEEDNEGNTELGEKQLDNIENLASMNFKDLESFIKKEPTDSDDDCYYVLVIDEKNEQKNSTSVPIVKEELVENEVANEYTEDSIIETDETQQQEENHNESVANNFETSIDSFIVDNTKVPINVPATILENEEESQDMEDYESNIINLEESQDSTSQDQIMMEEGPEKSMEEITTLTEDNLESVLGTLPSANNFIKILTSKNADGTILLKTEDGIEYFADTQLVTNEDGDVEMSQEEVILCEGDDSSQFQILKCDGSEMVIEYTDDGQIATVLQQEDGTFLCECGEQFEDLSEYEKHQYTHNPGGEHYCNMCGKGFESAEILTGHKLLHSVTGVLVRCPFCNQLVKRSVLTQHIKYGHNNIKPKCDICNKTFANPNNLKRHIMIHNDVKEFECDVCLRRFRQKITMQTHKLTHMNPLACNECDNIFTNKIDLTSHKDSNECSKSKVTRIKEGLMKTIKQEVKTSVGKFLGYACSLCKKMFSVESALENHIEHQHMVDPAELLCSECGEILPSKKDMQSHILTHKNYKMKNSKRFECSICGKGCASHAMLVMHERVHTNERPFPCQLCSLRFKTKTHLRTHQLTHTREKKFGCSVCMKFFALKGNLVVHLRTHTGERPYACTVCGEAFIDSKYLKKHKLKKHVDNIQFPKF